MHSKMMRSNLLLLLTAMIWGAAFVAQSVGTDYVGPFTFTAVRSFIAVIVLLPCIAFLDRRSPAQERKNAPHDSKALITGGILCGICLAAASSMQQTAISSTSVGKAGFITAMYIVIVPILGIFLRKGSRALTWISVALAAAGLYLLCMTQSLTLNTSDILLLLCAFCFAVHIMLIDHFSPRVDGVRMACLQFLVCGIICAVFAVIFESPDPGSILSAWIPLLYTGALSSAVGYTLQIIAQKNTDPVIASLLMSLESAFSVLAGWIILGQVLSAREMLGCLLMFAAIIIVQLPGRPARHTPAGKKDTHRA